MLADQRYHLTVNSFLQGRDLCIRLIDDLVHSSAQLAILVLQDLAQVLLVEALNVR